MKTIAASDATPFDRSTLLTDRNQEVLIRWTKIHQTRTEVDVLLTETRE